MSTEWKVIVPSGYSDATVQADTVEVVEGCLIFSDTEGATAVYSPQSWRLVIRQSDGKAVT